MQVYLVTSTGQQGESFVVARVCASESVAQAYLRYFEAQNARRSYTQQQFAIQIRVVDEDFRTPRNAFTSFAKG
jgi:hypothetical protein